MAFYPSRRKLRPRDEEDIGELNIVPYLDIMLNLIMFMLLSMSGLVSYGVLNVAAPKYAPPSAAASQNPATDDDKPALLLTVLISEKGFYVAGTGAVLPGVDPEAPQEEGTEGAPTVPKNSNGEYDYAALTARMLEIKKAFPEETKIILGADPKIPYDTLVKTMDAVREYNGQSLFFDVSLTII